MLSAFGAGFQKLSCLGFGSMWPASSSSPQSSPKLVTKAPDYGAFSSACWLSHLVSCFSMSRLVGLLGSLQFLRLGAKSAFDAEARSAAISQ